MPAYAVTVTRTSTLTLTLDLDASNRKQARLRALDEAGNHNFNDGIESEPVYEVESIQEIPPERP